MDAELAEYEKRMTELAADSERADAKLTALVMLVNSFVWTLAYTLVYPNGATDMFFVPPRDML